MSSSPVPLEGQWYRYRSESFYVLAVHEEEGLIDVRDDYGDIDEFDLDEWAGMDVEVCPAPIIETDVDSIRQR
jgi:hypothetical protein